MSRSKLSKVRAAAGKAGAAARWGGRGEKATACLRVYPSDAAELKRRAKDRGKLAADVVAQLLH